MNARKVLVVCSESHILHYVQELLQNAGHTVFVTQYIELALGVMEEQSIDLVVVDNRLPDLRGVVVCEAIRSDRRHENVPIVLLTNRSDGDAEAEVRQRCNIESLPKPFSPKVFNAMVERLTSTVGVPGTFE